MTMMDVMKNMVKAYDRQQALELKDLAHNLKGASGYIGASNVHYQCYFIQEHYVFKRIEEMWKYYPGLVEAVIEFRVFSRQLLAKHKSK